METNVRIFANGRVLVAVTGDASGMDLVNALVFSSLRHVIPVSLPLLALSARRNADGTSTAAGMAGAGEMGPVNVAIASKEKSAATALPTNTGRAVTNSAHGTLHAAVTGDAQQMVLVNVSATLQARSVRHVYPEPSGKIATKSALTILIVMRTAPAGMTASVSVKTAILVGVAKSAVSAVWIPVEARTFAPGIQHAMGMAAVVPDFLMKSRLGET